MRSAAAKAASASPAVKVRVSRTLSGASSCTGTTGPVSQAVTVTGSGE